MCRNLQDHFRENSVEVEKSHSINVVKVSWNLVQKEKAWPDEDMKRPVEDFKNTDEKRGEQMRATKRKFISKSNTTKWGY